MDFLLDATFREFIFFIVGSILGFGAGAKYYKKPTITQEEIECLSLDLRPNHKANITLYDGKRKSIDCPHYQQKGKKCLQMGFKGTKPFPVYKSCHIMN